MTSKKVFLAVEVWLDIKRHFLVYGLLAVLVMSAFSVIYFTHLNRQSTSSLELLLSERDELDIEWRNLLLEQNSLGEHSAIESRARNKLNMRRPDADSEIIIRLP